MLVKDGKDISASPTSTSALKDLLQLIEDYHDFNPETTVPVYPYPTEVQFSQQVARGRPCVYQLDPTVLQDNGPAITLQARRGGGRELISISSVSEIKLRKEQKSILGAKCFSWTKSDFIGLLVHELEVAVTPDGRADSLYTLKKRKRSDRTRCDGSQVEHDSTTDGEATIATSKGDPTLELEAEGGEQVFLQPATTHMTITALLESLCPATTTSSTTTSSSSTTPNQILYLQSQNSNLSLPSLSPLQPHLPETAPPFSHSVLGVPEATNIWIGNFQSITSTHRDPYENLYLVVKGRKKFVLYAAVEEVCLHAEMVRTGRWEVCGPEGRFEIIMDVDEDASPRGTMSKEDEEEEGSEKGSPRIPWIPIDPFHPPSPMSRKYPYHRYAKPLTVTVEEGQILYLPAGWFHHVSQECGQWEDEDGKTCQAPCIAINYWFDMDYSGEKHVMRELVGRLVERVRFDAG